MGEGFGSQCANFKTDQTCAHLCLVGFEDNNNGLGQEYTCVDGVFVGTALTCVGTTTTTPSTTTTTTTTTTAEEDRTTTDQPTTVELIGIFDGEVDKQVIKEFLEETLESFGSQKLAVTALIFVEVPYTGFSCAVLMSDATDNFIKLQNYLNKIINYANNKILNEPVETYEWIQCSFIYLNICKLRRNGQCWHSLLNCVAFIPPS